MSDDVLELQMLIQKAQRGDEAAFEMLLTRYEAVVFRFVYTIVRDREDARDVTQEIFIKLWQTLPRYRFESAFTTYLMTVSRNAALDFLRKQRRHRENVISLTQSDADGEQADLTLPDSDENADPVRSYLLKEQAQLLEKALLELPEQAREIIMLRTASGMSYDEIAQTLGIEIGTVKSRLNRAKNQLIKLLEQWNFF